MIQAKVDSFLSYMLESGFETIVESRFASNFSGGLNYVF
jgi:hypothetical protein